MKLSKGLSEIDTFIRIKSKTEVNFFNSVSVTKELCQNHTCY